MSDQSQVVELQATEVAASGGLFKGKDGKTSGRKVLGFIGFFAGICLGALAIILGKPWAVVAVGAGLPMGFSLVMYGFLTAQNGKEIIAAVKGTP
jgi:hypothetical protein